MRLELPETNELTPSHRSVLRIHDPWVRQVVLPQDGPSKQYYSVKRMHDSCKSVGNQHELEEVWR
jgi:hypothetical protein